MNLLSFFLLTVFIHINVHFISVSSTKPPFACDSSDPSTKSYTFCKTTLPLSVRVKDLISRLTLDEKISQLVNTAPGIPRLGIPSYQWWSESLHGVSGQGPGIHFQGPIYSATSFPQVILTASSFDAHLWYRIGQAIGIEARAVYNAGQATGMTFWAPNINIFRDPRWGRGQETPGEDPMVTSKYSVSYVRGIQGDSFEGGKLRGGHLQASACCKHFTAYDLDSWNGTTRYVFNAQVTLQDLADTYQPPFRSCITEGKASGIMCSYNRVNGVPSMDVNCGSYLQEHTKSAVQQKKVSETDINRALSNLFTTRMRLGLLNGNPTQQPFGKFGPNNVCSKAHQGLALEAALDGIVLLTNKAKLLPLSKTKTKTIAVIGPNANVAKTLQGNYFGPPCKTITPFEALKGYVRDTFYHPGCGSVACNSSVSIDQAVKLAKSVDNVIMVMGLDQTEEQEELDRIDLLLPGQQRALITSVAKAAKRPIVLVILSGGPVDIAFAKRDRKIGSIIWAGYPGEAGGAALAQIILGDHNPGGRLPITWYPQEFTKIPMTDMRMRANPATGYPGRTYRFYKGRKVFKFGHGLSYSKYRRNVRKASCFAFHKTIRDPTRKSSEAVDRVPKCETGCRRKADLEFTLSPCEHLSRANNDGLMVMEEGSHFLYEKISQLVNTAPGIPRLGIPSYQWWSDHYMVFLVKDLVFIFKDPFILLLASLK
ncbi:hypothetical protein C5167_017721 [Papaver somniferum]|uniref:Fibronectin type III-like domain-containing protein n=1 Tax=Papaver somniferum TaxID=3469 RepID=A0A4Y7IP74_PAPSO|nr:hypothetical protein C5167_017721 [Papaver somniferum]